MYTFAAKKKFELKTHQVFFENSIVIVKKKGQVIFESKLSTGLAFKVEGAELCVGSLKYDEHVTKKQISLSRSNLHLAFVSGNSETKIIGIDNLVDGSRTIVFGYAINKFPLLVQITSKDASFVFPCEKEPCGNPPNSHYNEVELG